jgi:hypothetical protein
MKTRLLLPHRYKAIGLLIALPAFILMILNLHAEFTFKFLDFQASGSGKISFDQNFLFNLQSNNFTDEMGGVLLITGLLLIAFSKEKFEDERIQTIRLESLLWAVFINSIFLILSIIFFYGNLFLQIMTYNMCTPLLLFIIRFNLLMYFERKKLKKEAL